MFVMEDVLLRYRIEGWNTSQVSSLPLSYRLNPCLPKEYSVTVGVWYKEPVAPCCISMIRVGCVRRIGSE
jgi:hypothetical protein